jgi:hypothetical protein
MSRIKVFGINIAGLIIIIIYNKSSRKNIISCYFIIYLGYEKVAEYYLSNRAGIALVRISWIN